MSVAMSSDFQLLEQYRAGSNAAFAELVTRHIDWIYSAARRRVRDEHLAEDVVQAVFMALASNRSLTEGTVMSGWLFGVMRYTSAKAVRAKERRQRHEMAAGEQRLAGAETSGNEEWKDLVPALDAAVESLGKRDREAILLRFYQRCSFADLGKALAISDEGARKRVARATVKLRHNLSARGAAISEVALAETMFSHLTQPAPASLGSSLSGGLRSSGSGSRLFQSWHRRARLRLLLQITGFVGAGVIGVLVTITVVLFARAGPAQTAGSITAAAIGPIQAVEPPTYATKITLDQIIAGVKKSEHEFQNVHVKDFETTTEKLPLGQTTWIPSKIRYAGSAWYDAEAGGKQRIYYSDWILPWENGARPWAESLEDLSWDGKEGRELRLASGSPGRLMRMRNARLSGDRPMMLDPYSRDWSGVGFTLQYLVTEEELVYPPKPRQFLSDILRGFAKAPKIPEIVGQKVNDFNSVRVRVAFRFGSISYWFDPSRGFALVKTENVLSLPGESRTEGLEVQEFKQCGQGIWFPTRASLVKEDVPQMGSYVRYNYRAGDVAVNDPKFDAAIFTATIPTGWSVDDDRTPTRRSYVIMENGKEMELHEGSVMPRIKAGVATRPDEPGPAITRDPRAWW
jgi:RNA polymerase sigma factor (sigma-70 family)